MRNRPANQRRPRLGPGNSVSGPAASTLYPTPNPNPQHSTPNTQHLTPNTQHPTPNTQHPTPKEVYPKIMSRNCPECSTPMKVDAYMGINFDVCPACAGLWVNPDELTNILQMDPEAFSRIEAKEMPQAQHGPAGPSQFRCPDDGAMLQQYHYMFNSPVVLHNCPNCSGFFVEDGQLDQMQKVVDDAKQQPITPDQAKKIAVGDMQTELDAYTARQRRWQSFFFGLSRFNSGWGGLWW